MSRRLKFIATAVTVFVVAALLYREHQPNSIHVANAYITGQLIKIKANTNGIVQQLSLQRGAVVGAGDLLLSLEKDQVEIQLNRAAAAYRSELEAFLGRCLEGAIVDKEVAKRYLEHNTQQVKEESRAILARNRVVSQEDYSNYKTASQLASLELQKMQLEQTKQALEIHRQLSHDTRVNTSRLDLQEAFYQLFLHESYAPKNAYVYDVMAFRGSRVNEGDLIAVLVPQDSLFIQANILEDVVGRIQPGQQVDIYVEALQKNDSKPLKGRVHSLVPATAAVFSPIPANNMDSTWVKVRQRVPVLIEFIDTPELDKGRLPIGASVELLINTDDIQVSSQATDSRSTEANPPAYWKQAFETRVAGIDAAVTTQTRTILQGSNCGLDTAAE